MKAIFADDVLSLIRSRKDQEVTHVQRGRVSGAQGGRTVKIHPNGKTVVFKVSAADGKQEITAHSNDPQRTAQEVARSLCERGDTRVSFH